MTHHLITAAFFAAALAAYTGSASSATAGSLLVLGVLCEGVGWWRLLRKRRPAER